MEIHNIYTERERKEKRHFSFVYYYSYYVLFLGPGFTVQEQPVLCTGNQPTTDDCPLDVFVSNVKDLNPVATTPGQGCCYIGASFYE